MAKTIEGFVEQFIREHGVVSYTPEDLAHALARFVVGEIMPRRIDLNDVRGQTFEAACAKNDLREEILKNAQALGIEPEKAGK